MCYSWPKSHAHAWREKHSYLIGTIRLCGADKRYMAHGNLLLFTTSACVAQVSSAVNAAGKNVAGPAPHMRGVYHDSAISAAGI